jgi:hypothetical protein
MKHVRWLNALIDNGVPSKTAAQFIKWHEQNPQVWREFEKLALELIAAGRKRYGAKCIMEVVRFNRMIETRTDFKVNNSYVTYYARIFAIKYPQYEGFFEERKIKGLKEQEAA